MRKFISIILAIFCFCSMLSVQAVDLAFTDISTLNAEQVKALEYCVDNKVIAGYEDNTFKPQANITRAEFATIISKFMGYEQKSNCTFGDASEHWASKYIQACVDKKAINGVGNNMFEPESNILFEQATKIITILKEYTTDEEANAHGGYPEAYIAIGKEKDLYTNVVNTTIGKELTRIDVVVMIYNTVDKTIGSADGVTDITIVETVAPSVEPSATDAVEPTVTPIPTATPKPTPTPIPETVVAKVEIGDYVQMGTYYKEPIVWRCIDVDENGPLMIADRILKFCAFDGARYETSTGSHSRGYQLGVVRNKTGSNYWYDSNVRSLLVSCENSGRVNWLCSSMPVNVYEAKNQYYYEAGFMNTFNDTEKDSIATVTLSTILDEYEYSASMAKYGKSVLEYNSSLNSITANYDDAYKESNEETIFLPGVKEISTIVINADILGEDYWKATPTEVACLNSSFKTTAVSEKYCNYWLRTPICNQTSSDVRVMKYTGLVEYDTAWYGLNGVRPCFYLNTDKCLFLKDVGDGTKDKPFEVLKHNGEIK